MTLPLEGIKVLDMTRLAPGPFCTMVLGDLGADIIKIEEPGPPTGRRAEQSKGVPQVTVDREREERAAVYNAMNRNKKSIALNLKEDEARQIFYKLARSADVIVEEFRPGVTKRLGIDYDTIKEMNPRIIYCAVTGYGQDGPYQNLVGHDINYISTAGALGAIGQRNGPPTIPLNLVADFAGGGMHGAIGVLAALMARERTGKGQYVDIAMCDGVVYLQAALLSRYFDTGRLIVRGEDRLNGGWPCYNAYETKDGKYISFGSLEPWFWQNLCKMLGREDFLPYQAEKPGSEKSEEIFNFFRKTFRTKTRDEWFEIMTKTDICVGKVRTYDELDSDPQIKHRQMIVEVDHPKYGKVKQVGIAMKLSETPGKIRSLAARRGEHTQEVLQDLGYPNEKIEELREAGIIL